MWMCCGRCTWYIILTQVVSQNGRWFVSGRAFVIMPEGIVDLRNDDEGKLGREEVAEIFAQRAGAGDTWTVSDQL
jgi:hypothetical protein